MALPITMILSSGGLRSLVATALAAAGGGGGDGPSKLVLVHLQDRHPSAAKRFEYMRRQAEHYRAAVLNIAPLHAVPQEALLSVAWANEAPLLKLPKAQRLLSALVNALEFGATSVVWPMQCDGDYQSIAQATEQVALLQQWAELERPQLPPVHTPLLELSDRQLVEVGHRLRVPWELAWSCQMPVMVPCRACPGCRRRRQAFAALGLADPIDETEPLRRGA